MINFDILSTKKKKILFNGELYLILNLSYAKLDSKLSQGIINVNFNIFIPIGYWFDFSHVIITTFSF